MQRLDDPLTALRERLQQSAAQLPWAQLPVAPSQPNPPISPAADADPISPAADAPAADAPTEDAPAAAAPAAAAPAAPAADATPPAAPQIPFVYASTLVALNSSLPIAPAYLRTQTSDFVTTVAGMPLQPQGDGTLRSARAPRRSSCGRCARFNPDGTACSSGRGGAIYCSVFNEDGSPAVQQRKKRKERSGAPCKLCRGGGLAKWAGARLLAFRCIREWLQPFSV
mmetsp:Transcript_4469/g.11693  ORF Transcript_4469/g.11693 Transcript_4469/m.11693 type:complete len:226 (-) Transcript_4469:6-683(-)